jgi:6-phosphogluconate dehydrogenase
MVGGDSEAVELHKQLFLDLATENGFAHVGGPSAGHFTKMVHNAIEYGMMGAIAEGVNILNEHKEALAIDITEALKPYEHGSIIESSLMSWLGSAYNTKGLLERIGGEVPKGETEMEMEYLISSEEVLVLEAAVLQRKITRTKPSFTGTLIAAMRNQFGGHAIINKETIRERK